MVEVEVALVAAAEVAAAEDVARLLPVVVEAEVGLPAADREELVAVEERVRE